MRKAVLFGSGISLPGKVPGVEKITESILSGQGIYAHTDGNFYLGATPPGREAGIEQVVEFVRILNEELKEYIGDRRLPNYEDIFYLACQIRDEEEMELDNVAVRHFAKLMETCALERGALSKRTIENPHGIDSIHRLAERAAAYIECVVWKLIETADTKTDSFSHLDWICGIVPDISIDIYSLNHDRLIETLLIQHGIAFVDGFGEPDGTLRYWDPRLLDDENSKVRLFKLHGGVDWFQFESIDTVEDWRSRSVARTTGGEYEHAKNKEGVHVKVQKPRPLMLVGTFNKLATYNYGVFGDLISRFHLNLDQYSKLLISGYGFGDKGINTKVLDWVWSENKNRIVLVEPNPDGLKTRARHAVSRAWDTLIEEGKLQVIQSGIEEVSECQMRDALE